MKLVDDASQTYKYWFNRYKFHPTEITANNNMVLNRLAPNTQELMGQIGPKQTKLALDNVLNVSRGTDKINDNGIKLLGSEGVGHIGALRDVDKLSYQKFMKDLYKQVSYLESQMNLINENEESEYRRIYKKTQLVFKTLREGRIRTKSGVVFSYKIPKTNVHISVSGGQTENPSGFVMVERIYIKQESPECIGLSYGHFGDLIKKRFRHFDIQFSFTVYPQDIEGYNSHPINEAIDWQDENSSNLTDDQLKQLKRAKTVYKALKKGKVTSNFASSFDERDEHTIKYELGDPYYYWIYVAGTNTFRIEISKITVYIDDHKFYERAISKEVLKGNHKTMEWILLHNVIAPRVRKRFGNNDIDIRAADADLIFEYIEPQPINEGEDKRIKKARTIYKAFKKGLLNKGEHGNVKYELPDEYKVYVRSIDDVLVIRVGEEEDDNHVKFFFNDDDGTGDRPTKAGPKYYNAYVGKIWEKYFNNFDIKLIC